MKVSTHTEDSLGLGRLLLYLSTQQRVYGVQESVSNILIVYLLIVPLLSLLICISKRELNRKLKSVKLNPTTGEEYERLRLTYEWVANNNIKDGKTHLAKDNFPAKGLGYKLIVKKLNKINTFFDGHEQTLKTAINALNNNASDGKYLRFISEEEMWQKKVSGYKYRI
jgi:hypothetical protein